MDKTNLPPLPEPYDEPMLRDHPYYTTKQMREYAARAVREAVPGWQPIETAPRDGTLVIGYWPSGHFHVGAFSEDGYWRREMDEAAWMDPSHWMPLPAAPTQDQENGS